MMGLKDFYFRATDRLRLEGCVAAMLTEGMSLVVSSEHDAVLDHYGKLMVERLRQSSPNTQVEIYFPANAEVVLARFNSMVAEHSFEEAMKASAGQPPARIWLVHDAGALADGELQLLARLVQSFPGARVRLIFLVGSRGHSRALFDSFGRGVLRWDIDVPSMDLAQSLLEKAKTEGHGPEVQALLAKISLPPSKSPPGFEKHLLMDDPEQTHEDSPSSQPSSRRRWFKWPGQSDVKSKAKAKSTLAKGNPAKSAGQKKPLKSNQKQKPKPEANKTSRQGLKVFLAVLFLLLVSFAITLVLHPDLFQTESAKAMNIKPIGQAEPSSVPKEPKHE